MTRKIYELERDLTIPVNNFCLVALERGFKLSIFDGMEWSISKSKDLEAILHDIWGVETGMIRLYHDSGEYIGTAVFLLDNPDFQIIDYTIDKDGIMDSIWEFSHRELLDESSS